jgi:hypothetical protein
VRTAGSTGGLSKLSSGRGCTPVPGFSLASAYKPIEVDIVLGDPVVRTKDRSFIDGPGASGVIAPESLERR